MTRPRRIEEEGFALLVALIGLSLFSLLSIYVAWNGSTEIRISDNFESQIQARYAAHAGINHSREVLRGLRFHDVLTGPDGTHQTGGYLEQAKLASFRNPISLSLARTLDIANPSSSIFDNEDDGIINTGKYGSVHGTVLIPQIGVAQTIANPHGGGMLTLSRYFVKSADNSGEATELSKDSSDDPFYDGDGLIIVRSMGIAQTIGESVAGGAKRCSVAVLEARFKRRATFSLEAPLVVEGNRVLPSNYSMFSGDSFRVDGMGFNYGIGAIDVAPTDGISPVIEIRSSLAQSQRDNVVGSGLIPSVADITTTISADSDKALLLDPAYIWNFVNTLVPQFADSVYRGPQHWNGSGAPYIGSYDSALPPNAPGQDPKVTFVDGDLSLSGNMSGGGLLVVTGKFSCNGSLAFNGLVLVVGTGDMDAGDISRGITGGVYVANITASGGAPAFGTPKLTISGNSNITFNSQSIQMAVALIPPAQVSLREVTSTIDP